MEDRTARRLIPEPHALALRLREAGADHELIAVALEIEPEGVPGLLRVAEAKLAELESSEAGQGDRDARR